MHTVNGPRADEDPLNAPTGFIEKNDGNRVTGGLVPQGFQSRGEHRIVGAAGQILQVHRQLGENDVEAPGIPGAYCILQARQGETVFHLVPCPRPPAAHSDRLFSKYNLS